jgi:membrane protein
MFPIPLTPAALGLYVSNFGSYDATYGSIGGVIVLLMWFYITAAIFLLGGKLNAVLENASAGGKQPGERAEHEGAMVVLVVDVAAAKTPMLSAADTACGSRRDRNRRRHPDRPPLPAMLRTGPRFI